MATFPHILYMLIVLPTVAINFSLQQVHKGNICRHACWY